LRRLAAVLEAIDLRRFLQRQADIVQPVQQAMPAVRVDLERTGLVLRAREGYVDR
jgi:hypothetical protein